MTEWLLTGGGRLQESSHRGPWKIINRQTQKVVAVAYRRWSFTRGSNCNALTGKILVFWIGGRSREVIAHGGLTVFTTLHFLYLLFDESANWPSRTSCLIYIVVFRPVRCKSLFMLQKRTYYNLVGLNCFCHIARIWLSFFFQYRYLSPRKSFQLMSLPQNRKLQRKW